VDRAAACWPRDAEAPASRGRLEVDPVVVWIPSVRRPATTGSDSEGQTFGPEESIRAVDILFLYSRSKIHDHDICQQLDYGKSTCYIDSSRFCSSFPQQLFVAYVRAD